MKTYALASVEMVNTPGLVRWGINGYKFRKDRKKILNVFTSGWNHEENPNNPPKEAFQKLLSEEIPFEVHPNDVVVFEA